MGSEANLTWLHKSFFFFNRPAGLGISNNPDINVIDCYASGMMIENHLLACETRIANERISGEDKLQLLKLQ